MADVRRVRGAPTDGIALEVFLGHAPAILDTLGRRTDGGFTLVQLAAADPTVLKRWAASTGRAPLSQEKRAFAKAALGLVEGGYLLGFDVAPPAAPPAAPASSTAVAVYTTHQSPSPVGEPAPAAVHRRGVAVTRVATGRASPYVTVGFKQLQRAWSWAPLLTSIFCVAVVLVFLRFPYLLVCVLVKLVSMCWAYLGTCLPVAFLEWSSR